MRKRIAGYWMLDDEGKRIWVPSECMKCHRYPAYRKKVNQVFCGACGKGHRDVVGTKTGMHPALKMHFSREE